MANTGTVAGNDMPAFSATVNFTPIDNGKLLLEKEEYVRSLADRLNGVVGNDYVSVFTRFWEMNNSVRKNKFIICKIFYPR